MLDALIILLIILNSQSIYSVSLDKDFHLLVAFFVVLGLRLILSAGSYFSILRGKVLVLWIIWLIYSAFFLGVSGSINGSFVQRFIVIPLMLIPYFSYSISQDDLKKLLGYYSNWVRLIAIISLFFWLFGSLLHVINPSGLQHIFWGKELFAKSYYGIYFEWQNDAQILGRTFFRNIGIFTEAPMFSLHLSVALMIDFLLLGKKGLAYLALYGITFLSTFSVTGILLFLVTVGSVMVLDSAGDLFKQGKIKVWWLLIPVLLVIAIVIGRSLFTDKIQSASGSSRMEDYRIGFKAWRLRPWFGFGYGNTEVINSLKSRVRFMRSATGFTNSPTRIMVEGGIYFLSSYLLAFWATIKRGFQVKSFKLVLFGLLWVYLFATTTFEHSLLIIAFLMIAFSLLVNPSQQKSLR